MRKVRLGEYIEQCDERNSQGKFDVTAVRGISINKVIIDTKADMAGVSLTPYKLLKPQEFAFVPVTSRNGEKISLAENTTTQTFIVSSSYEVFRVKDKSRLLPDFLYLWFSCPEFDRYARFNSWGSAREAFSYAEMERVKIPLPSLGEQKAYVAAWQGLKELADNNAQMADSLFALCQSYIEYLRKKYPSIAVGDYITPIREKNTEQKIKLEQGIDIQKRFIHPQRSNADLSSRIVVRRGQFAYCTQLNNENVAIAYRTEEDCVVSPVYAVFEINRKDKLLPEYLLMWLIRSEFGRYVYWASTGSAYEFLRWENLCSYKIPLPPIEVQKAIVAIYRCAQENKAIAGEAAALSKSICPALMRQAMAGGAQ